MTDEKKSKQDHSGARAPDEQSADPAVGTEAALGGGKEPARREANRDWENSAKESGE